MANSYKHRTGDRKEGRLLRSLPADDSFFPYLVPGSTDDLILYEESFDVTKVTECLFQEREGGYENINFLHFFIAAYIRCVSIVPSVNRYIIAQRIFTRDGIDVIVKIRRSEKMEGSEAKVKIHFEPTDTIFDVYRKINEKTDELRSQDYSTSLEEIASTFTRSTRLLKRAVVFGLRIADRFGLLSEKFMDTSIYHASMAIDDASILKCGPFWKVTGSIGSIPMYVSFGESHRVNELSDTGEVIHKEVVDYRFTADTRITDPRNFSQFLQALRYIYEHPIILEKNPSRVVEDAG